GDSTLNPPAGGTFATRQLYMSGNAVLKAARELRDRIAPVAAEILGRPPGELVFADGKVSPNCQPGDSAAPATPGLTLAELAAACERRGVHTSHLSVWRAAPGPFHPPPPPPHPFPP